MTESESVALPLGDIPIFNYMSYRQDNTIHEKIIFGKHFFKNFIEIVFLINFLLFDVLYNKKSEGIFYYIKYFPHFYIILPRQFFCQGKRYFMVREVLGISLQIEDQHMLGMASRFYQQASQDNLPVF